MSKMSKQVVEVLTVLHALISDALGVSHDDGDEPSVLDDLSDDDLKQLARNLDLATPRQLSRMGREKLVALFEDVDDEVIQENLNDPDGEVIQENLNDPRRRLLGRRPRRRRSRGGVPDGTRAQGRRSA